MYAEIVLGINLQAVEPFRATRFSVGSASKGHQNFL